MKLLIGHVGEPLAGKETVSKLIAERAKRDGLSVGWLQFRDPLQETLQILGAVSTRHNPSDPRTYTAADAILKNVWNVDVSPEKVRAFIRLMSAHFDGPVLEVNRPNLQKLAVLMKKPFGDGALSHAVFSRVKKRSEDIMQADGIRWLTDESALRKVRGAVMLYTTARFEIRAERAKTRKKEGEEHKTVEQLRLEEQAENERYIAEIGARADHKIVNESDSLDILKNDIETFYMAHVHPRTRKLAIV